MNEMPTRAAHTTVRGRGRLAVAILAVLTSGLVAVLVGGAVAKAPAAHTHHRHSRPHRQALSGPLSRSRTRVVKVIIRGGKGGAVNAGDDYPPQWRNRAQDSTLDQWREYNRECTSFVAWALYSRSGFNMPFYDNANGWGSDAARRGFAVNSTPAVGSVAWSNIGTWGHVAYVVAVSAATVTIQEYNHYGTGTYDQRTVPASNFTGYIHFRDVSPPQLPVNPNPGPTTVTTTTTSTTTVGATTTTTTSGTGAGTTAPQPVNETTGGVTHTWTNYTNAGGTQGPSIPSNATVQVSCKVTGFRVADGDTWWYRIASGPWSNAYYASADAFYNNGRTSGSLVGTPFVDPSVPDC